jgi:hypothetical protein
MSPTMARVDHTRCQTQIPMKKEEKEKNEWMNEWMKPQRYNEALMMTPLIS